jgi:predicted branched-subunit amino acid permease
LLAAVIGARLFLMSVAMRPWFGQRPAWQAHTALFFLTDATWLIAMRYRAEGGRDIAVYFARSFCRLPCAVGLQRPLQLWLHLL